MSGPFDFIHLKGSTKGSSNELSFDVLDAASRGITEGSKKGRTPSAPTAPKPSQGSYHGVTGASSLSSAPEVTRRKRARRSRTIRLWALGSVALIAVMALVGFAGYSFYQGKVDFNSRFNALVDRLSEVDESLVEVDALMKNPIAAAEAQARAAAAEGFGELEGELSGIADGARAAMEDFTGDAETAALAEVEEAAGARNEMVRAARDAFALASIVNEKKAAANEAWGAVLSADALAREASELANGATTEEATLQARAKTEEARSAFLEARAALVAVEDSVKGVSYADELTYIDKRVEALDAALATADALLAYDRDTAAAQNSAYNSADLDATALAQGLSGSVDGRVEAAFEDEMRQCAEAYSSARAEASTADAALRRLRG